MEYALCAERSRFISNILSGNRRILLGTANCNVVRESWVVRKWGAGKGFREAESFGFRSINVKKEYLF